jgi:hypothetical protein
LELLVRSHEARQHGYSVHHGGRCITIFSAPNYCDTQGNLGAVLVFERAEDQREPPAAEGDGEGEVEKKDADAAAEATPETEDAVDSPASVPKTADIMELPADSYLETRVTSGAIYAIGNNLSPHVTVREESHHKDRSDAVPGQEAIITKVLQFAAVPHPLSPKRINPLPTLKN